MGEPLSEHFTFRVSRSLRQRIVALADQDHRTLGDWIRLALEEVADERELRASLAKRFAGAFDGDR